MFEGLSFVRVRSFEYISIPKPRSHLGAILGSTGGMIQSMYWPFFFSLGGKPALSTIISLIHTSH